MSTFQVDDGRSFVGDLYWAKLPSHPVPLIRYESVGTVNTPMANKNL